MNEIDFRTVLDINKKVVAIVRFGPPSDEDGLKPGEYFQVTIDPEHFSPTREYIRFGPYPGDELVGWQRADMLAVMDILAEWNGDEPPLIPWYSRE